MASEHAQKARDITSNVRSTIRLPPTPQNNQERQNQNTSTQNTRTTVSTISSYNIVQSILLCCVAHAQMKRRQSHWIAVSLLLATSMLRLHCTFCLSLPRGTRAPIARTTTRLSLSQTTCHAENHTTYPQETTQDWRNHPDLNPLLTFQTWKVPSKHVQSVLQSPLLVQPPSVETTKRIRLVRPYNDTHQLVLRRQLVQEDHVEESLPQELLVSLNVTEWPRL